ncbi:MAG: hypothetical protein ACRC80_00280, partial [Waterburya sp.]
MSALSLLSLITDLNLVDQRQINKIERVFFTALEHLNAKGISFFTDTDLPTKKKIQGALNHRTIFNTYFFQDRIANTYKIKSYEDLSYELVLNFGDFELARSSMNKNAIYQVILERSIQNIYYLEIEAVWGLFDINDCPVGIYEAILDYSQASLIQFESNLSIQNNGGAEILSSKIGEVQTTFGKTKRLEPVSTFFENII